MAALQTLPEAIRRFQRDFQRVCVTLGQITYTANDGKQRAAPREFGFDPACPGDWNSLLGCLGEAMRAGLLPKPEEVARRYPGVPPTTVYHLLIMFAWVASEQRGTPITGRYTSAAAAAACSLWPGKAVPGDVWELVQICLEVMRRRLKKGVNERFERVPEIVLAILAGWERGPLFSPSTPGWIGTPKPIRSYWEGRAGYAIRDFFEWGQTPSEEREERKMELARSGKHAARASASASKGTSQRVTSSNLSPDEVRFPSQADGENNDAPDLTAEYRPQSGRIIGLRVAGGAIDWLIKRVQRTYLALRPFAGGCDCYTRKRVPEDSKPKCDAYHSIHSWDPDRESIWEHSNIAFVGISGQEAFAFHGKFQDGNFKGISSSILADAFAGEPIWNSGDRKWIWTSSGRKIAERRVAHWFCPRCKNPNILYYTPVIERTPVVCPWCKDPTPWMTIGPFGFDEKQITIVEQKRLVLLVDPQGDADPDEQAVEEYRFWLCENLPTCGYCRVELGACPRCENKRPEQTRDIHLWVARTMRFLPSGGELAKRGGDGFQLGTLNWRPFDDGPPHSGSGDPHWSNLAGQAFSERFEKPEMDALISLLDSLIDWWAAPSLAPILADDMPQVHDPVWAALKMAPPAWMTIKAKVRSILQDALEEAKETPRDLDQFLTLHGLLHRGARKWHPQELFRVELLRIAFSSLVSKPPQQWRWLLAKNVCPRDDGFWGEISGIYEKFNNASTRNSLPNGARPAWEDWKVHHPDVRIAFEASARLFGQSQLIAIADSLRP